MRLHPPLFFDKPLLKVPKLVSRIPPVRASSELAVFCRPKQEPQARSPRKMQSCGFPQEGPDAGPGSAAPLFTAASLTQSWCSCSSWRPAADVGTVRQQNDTPSVGFSRADRSVPDSARAALNALL
ncbi:hypothetical protein HPB50_008091 [Hyalomma asiaticum]|uniref:Uncharacterized protein n=1 Tax=Hyalomma asiaticum TaxID=266040 RepID=A0ACB7RT46_HYAAI|nr:hypothetical protein HPB50_008091 [Hyalomma asiaticum]